MERDRTESRRATACARVAALLIAIVATPLQLHASPFEERFIPMRFTTLLTAPHPLEAAAREARADFAAMARRMGPLDANPILELTPGYRLTGVDAPGPEWAISIAQSLALGDQLGSRREALNLEGEFLEAEVDAASLERRLGAAHLWLDAWSHQAGLALIEDEAAILDALAAWASRAAETGQGTLAEAALAEGARDAMAARALALRGQLTDTSMALAHLLGHTGEGPLPLPAGDLPSPPRPSREALLAVPAQLPAARLAAVSARLEQARLRELESSRDLRLTIALMADSDSEGNIATRIGVAVPLNVLDPVAREAPGAAATARTALAMREATQRLLSFRLRGIAHELDHSAEVLATLEGRSLPTRERAVAIQTRRFEAGEVTAFELLDARRQRVDVRALVLDAQVAHARARVEAWLIWRAAGGLAPEEFSP